MHVVAVANSCFNGNEQVANYLCSLVCASLAACTKRACGARCKLELQSLLVRCLQSRA